MKGRLFAQLHAYVVVEDCTHVGDESGALIADPGLDPPGAVRPRKPLAEAYTSLVPGYQRRGLDFTAQERNERSGETTVYTCPECGGTLWQVEHNGLAQFNCYVRHAYAPEALLGQMSARQPAGRLRAAGQEDRPARVEEQAHLDDRHGQLIRSVLLELTPNPETQPLVQQAPEEDRREGQLPASADGG